MLFINLFICSRNPFFYSGHFNWLSKLRGREISGMVAIPSFIQGISTQKSRSYWGLGKNCCRNPFFYSGHFNVSNKLWWRLSCNYVAIPSFIQGISTLRLGDLEIGIAWVVAIPSFIQGISTKSLRKEDFSLSSLSQSLLLFRAFQLGRGECQVSSHPQVAIPSFIQGISTLRLEILDR